MSGDEVKQPMSILPESATAYYRDWLSYLTRPGAYPGLDWLRAAAIAMVMAWHWDNGFSIGWTGVDLFFVLSGFLVGGSVIDQMKGRRFRVLDYASSRFLRIYPLYLVVIIAFCTWAYEKGLILQGDVLYTAALHLAFLQTLSFYLFNEPIPLIYDITWSLVVEVTFYSIIPLVIYALLRSRWIGMKTGLLAIVVLYPAIRFYLSSSFLANDVNWHYFIFLRPHYRLDELVYGVIAALTVSESTRYTLRSYAMPSILIGLAILSGVFLYLIFGLNNPDGRPVMAMLTRDSIVIPTYLALGYSLLLVGALEVAYAPSFVVAIARLAYPLYLVHIMVKSEVTSQLHYYLASAAVAVALSFCVEYPFIRLYKGRRKAGAVAVAPA